MTDMQWSDLGFIGEHWALALFAVIILATVESIIVFTRERRSGRWLRHGTPFFRWLLIAVAFSLILVAIHPLRLLITRPLHSDASTATQQGTQPNQTSGPSAADLNRTSMDDLKLLLSILAGFAVITSIAQVAAAWFSALTYDKQASAKLAEIQKSLDDLKAKYPIFSEIEEKRNQVHDSFVAMLRRVFSPDDADDPNNDPTEAIAWMGTFYPKFPVEERQLLLSVESFISIDLHPPRNEDEVQSLKVFAIFYHAKFQYEKKVLASPFFSDLERAEGYILRALRKAPGDFTLYNDLGNLYLTMNGHVSKLPLELDYARKAREALNCSVYFRPAQQRAYYNLAYLLAHEGKFKEAVQQLEIAIPFTTWQRMPTPESIRAYVYYNLGCYRARSVAADHKAADAQNNTLTKITAVEAKPVTSALKEAADLSQIRPDSVDDDFSQSTGDIFELYQNCDPALKKELDSLWQELKQKRTKKSPKGFFRSLADLVQSAAQERFDSIFRKP